MNLRQLIDFGAGFTDLGSRLVVFVIVCGDRREWRGIGGIGLRCMAWFLPMADCAGSVESICADYKRLSSLGG
jgi:hypothetical protein